MVRSLPWGELDRTIFKAMRSPLSPKLSLVGGILAGIGASACCLGPLLLLSLGISGAWISHLTALEPLRPIFLLLTVLFLALAFRKLYMVPPNCNTGVVCVVDPTRRAQRLLFWIVTALVGALATSPWFLPLLYR
jgi:mercuric ion transport protein